MKPITPKTLVARLLLLLRWMVALGLLYLIYRSLSPDDLASVLAKTNLWLVVAAVLVQLLSSLVAGVRWGCMMRYLGYGGRWDSYLSSYLQAVLFNQGLPTSVGGDALRVVHLVGWGLRKRDALALVLSDRIFGISGMLLLALVAANVLDNGFSVRFLLVTSMVCLVALAGVGVVALAGVLPGVRTTRLQRVALFEPLWIVSRSLRRVMCSPLAALVQLCLALATHVCTAVAFWCLGLALGVHLPWQTYLVFAPLLTLFALIPLSLAGWGIRETGAVALLSLLGVGQEQAFAMSLLFGLALIVTAAPGLLLYVRSKPAGRQAD